MNLNHVCDLKANRRDGQNIFIKYEFVIASEKIHPWTLAHVWDIGSWIDIYNCFLGSHLAVVTKDTVPKKQIADR